MPPPPAPTGPGAGPAPPTDLPDLLRVASRTFAIGIEALPEELQAEVRTAYLLLRVSDFLEDDPDLAAERKASLLETWATVLLGASDIDTFVDDLGPVTAVSPDAQVAARASEVFAAFRGLAPPARRALARHVVDTTRGMARWVRTGPVFARVADLDDYMHEVAGRVGYLLTELFAERIPRVREHQHEMMRLGREFGLGLQTVNVIRGLHEDHRRGWVYVPRTFLPPDIADPAEILRDAPSPVTTAALDRLCAKAAEHLEDAVRYVDGIPESERGVRVFCMLPLFFAARTLALSRGNPDVFRQEVKMPRSEVLKVTARTRLRAGSNVWMRKYARRLLAGRRP